MSDEPRDVRRPGVHRGRWVLPLVAVVLAACLLYTVHEVTVGDRTVHALQSQQAGLLNERERQEALVKQLTTEHDLLLRQRATLLAEIDRLTSLPPTIVSRACAERSTPVFESRYTVGR